MATFISTFSANSAGLGGAIYNVDRMLTITASTFSGNIATFDGGAIFNNGTTSVSASILANSPSGGNCSGAGAITSNGSNLSDDASCSLIASGDIPNSAMVNLGSLADNGGPTQTMPPQPGSAAIDTAACSLSSATDQRGVSRPATGTSCDKGAVETTGAVPVQLITAYTSSGAIAEGGSATIHAIASGPAGASLEYDVDCDNSGSYETQGTGTGNAGSASCSFGDNGTFTVGVRVCAAGNCVTGSASVTVNNVAPTITNVANSGPVDEGSLVTITVTASDPAGGNDPLQYQFDCGNDGSYEIGPQADTSALCTFGDNGSFIVGVRVSDGDGGSATGSTEVSVLNLAPTIISVSNDGPVAEGSPATITVTASDPAGINDPLQYEFDCDNDTVYEVGPQAADTTTCTFGDNGLFTVGVQVSDGDGGEVSSSTTVIVLNVAPTVDTPETDESPSDEGASVTASAPFSDPGTADTHTCTVDYGDGSGAQAGTVVGLTCTGPVHTYLDDDPSGTASDDYAVTIAVTDDDGGEHGNTAVQTVDNLPPVIDSITTNAPVPQGQPVTITVHATDAGGAGDPLSFAFDCDGNGSYETAGAGNQGMCTLDPGAASTSIGVQVTDDDLGVVTGSVLVGQTLTLCLSYTTGALSAPNVSGACAAGSAALVLPSVNPVTLCINAYTGAIMRVASGVCPAGQRAHLVPGSGPLAYCQSLWTGKLRVAAPGGKCVAYELPGVIPG